ncbi:hypothetical protein C8E87_0726 [Paractinoplanes brasiliensis]|uniref:Uncharacterized protein n=1 Tax=Paractinoplanes brasiliensis TaxID=52695 RepID=A0A4V6PSU0_9ACTN|nr:hypothetical protein C8E87_0726 [Actinoplanes brasiliensis]
MASVREAAEDPVRQHGGPSGELFEPMLPRPIFVLTRWVSRGRHRNRRPDSVTSSFVSSSGETVLTMSTGCSWSDIVRSSATITAPMYSDEYSCSYTTARTSSTLAPAQAGSSTKTLLTVKSGSASAGRSSSASTVARHPASSAKSVRTTTLANSSTVRPPPAAATQPLRFPRRRSYHRRGPSSRTGRTRLAPALARHSGLKPAATGSIGRVSRNSQSATARHCRTIRSCGFAWWRYSGRC